MPGMDGLTFLEGLKLGYPIPVVMISSLIEMGDDATVRSLDLDAVGFVSKPKIAVFNGTVEHAEEILAKVKAAVMAGARRARAHCTVPAAGTGHRPQFSATHIVVALGASKGRKEALKDLPSPLPETFPASSLCSTCQK